MKSLVIVLATAMMILTPRAVLAADEPKSDAKYRVATDVPYAVPANPRQMLDVYAPPGAKNLPIVFWIHGGGWVSGDKSVVQVKPQAFAEKGYVFVSVSYRYVSDVKMAAIMSDIAKAIRWTHDHAATYGGDPDRMFVMGIPRARNWQPWFALTNAIWLRKACPRLLSSRVVCPWMVTPMMCRWR